MKQIRSIAIIIAVILGLWGCGSQKGKTDSAASSTFVPLDTPVPSGYLVENKKNESRLRCGVGFRRFR